MVPFCPLPSPARPAAGPTLRDRRTTGSRIPLVSAAGTTNRQRVEKLSRPSSTSFLIRLSPSRSVDQTKESEKQPTTSEFQGPISFSSSLSLPLIPLPPCSVFSFSLFYLPPSLPRSFQLSLPRPENVSSTMFTATYARLVVCFLSLSFLPSRISMLPPLTRELYNGILGICLDNAPWLARYSALFYAVRGASAVLPRAQAVAKNGVP